MLEQKTILTMSKKQVQIERWKLEQAGLIADCSWYLEDLLYQLKNGRVKKCIQPISIVL